MTPIISNTLSITGEKKERCQPVSHCWTPDSKLYCGCKGGQVISVDTETSRVTIVLNPSVQESERNRTETLSLLRKTTMESIAEEVQGDLFIVLCCCQLSLYTLASYSVKWHLCKIDNWCWSLCVFSIHFTVFTIDGRAGLAGGYRTPPPQHFCARNIASIT